MRKFIAAALVLACSLALAGDFVTNHGSTVPNAKLDAKPCPYTDPNKCNRAVDFNAQSNAALDLRAWVWAPWVPTNAPFCFDGVTCNSTLRFDGTNFAASRTISAPNIISSNIVSAANVISSGPVTGNTLNGDASPSLSTATGSTTPRTLAARAADVVNVKDFGAKGDGTTDDTIPIQAALTFARTRGGARVVVPESTAISTALVIGSNTWLDVAPHATVTMISGSAGNGLNNYAVSNPVRSVADAAITTGTTTLTSATAAFTSADVGRSVVVAGAGPGGGGAQSPSPGVLCTTIASVTNSTTVVLTDPAFATVSGAALSIYTRDTNIRVTGGTWARTGVGASSGVGLHFLRFRRVDGLQLSDVRVTTTGGKYAVSVGDCTGIQIDRHQSQTSSDGIHFTGPVAGVRIRGVSGTTNDDSIAFTSLDWLTYNDVGGAITDVVVENVGVNTPGSQVKLMCGTNAPVGRVIVRNVLVPGLGVSAHAVSLIDDQAGTAPISNVLVDGVHLKGTAGTALFLSSASAKNVVIRNIFDEATNTGESVWVGGTVESLTLDGWSRPSTATGARRAVTMDVAASIGTLRVQNARANLAAGAPARSIVNTAGTATNVYLDGIEIDIANSIDNVPTIDLAATSSFVSISRFRASVSGAATGTTGLIRVQAAPGRLLVDGAQVALADTNATPLLRVQAAVTSLVMSNVQQANGRALMAVYGAITYASLNGVQISGTGRLIEMYSAVDVTLSGVVLQSLVSPAIYVSGATLTVRGAGVVSAAAMVQRAAAEVIHVINPDVPADLSILAKTDGDMATNTNGALACGVGKAISNGTNWKNIYSGAVY